MDRRRFLLTSLAGALALVAPADGQAQGPTRVPTIGVLSPVSPTTPSFVQSRGEFEAGLKELGWAPGHTVRIDYRHADGQRDRLSELARELVRDRIDVVVARSAAAVQAAKEATSTTPIVMSASGLDPVQIGFVSSLARPGGNITGLTLLTDELLGKQLELLREAVPLSEGVT